MGTSRAATPMARAYSGSPSRPPTETRLAICWPVAINLGQAKSEAGSRAGAARPFRSRAEEEGVGTSRAAAPMARR